MRSRFEIASGIASPGEAGAARAGILALRAAAWSSQGRGGSLAELATAGNIAVFKSSRELQDESAKAGRAGMSPMK
jgi:hypothetical protein